MADAFLFVLLYWQKSNLLLQIHIHIHLSEWAVFFECVFTFVCSLVAFFCSNSFTGKYLVSIHLFGHMISSRCFTCRLALCCTCFVNVHYWRHWLASYPLSFPFCKRNIFVPLKFKVWLSLIFVLFFCIRLKQMFLRALRGLIVTCLLSVIHVVTAKCAYVSICSVQFK